MICVVKPEVCYDILKLLEFKFQVEFRNKFPFMENLNLEINFFYGKSEFRILDYVIIIL